MARRGSDPTATPIIVEAALVPAGRKALTLDADGEATLTLVIPATDAPLLVNRFQELMDRTLRLAIVPDPK